jgi:hypothetical protein
VWSVNRTCILLPSTDLTAGMYRSYAIDHCLVSESFHLTPLLQEKIQKVWLCRVNSTYKFVYRLHVYKVRYVFIGSTTFTNQGWRSTICFSIEQRNTVGRRFSEYEVQLKHPWYNSWTHNFSFPHRKQISNINKITGNHKGNLQLQQNMSAYVPNCTSSAVHVLSVAYYSCWNRNDK